MTQMVYTAVVGNNADLIERCASLYLKDGDKVADITYGKGVFWKRVDTSRFDFKPSDRITCPKTPYDFTDLPYKDSTFDVVVFDPPYVHNPGNLIVNDNYMNAETTKGFYHKDIMAYYVLGMAEATRVLKEDGFLWVKCKDEISSSVQRWSHIEIARIGEEMGLYCKDLMILVQSGNPIIQHKRQLHARKNHSYLWVLQKLPWKKMKIAKRHLGKDSSRITEAIGAALRKKMPKKPVLKKDSDEV